MYFKKGWFLASGLALALLAVAGCAFAAPTFTPAPPLERVTPPAPTASPTRTPVPPPSPTPTLTPSPTATPAPAATPEPSRSVDGHWRGSLSVLGTSLELGVEFQTRDGELAATIDIPQQGVEGLALSGINFAGSRLAFAISEVGAEFEGELQEDGTISGTFSQSGVSGTFTLERSEEREQTEEAEAETGEEVDYREEEVVFHNEEITLAGTLTLPPGDGPHPAVVLISGSGAQDRNENIFGFPVFGVIAHHLSNRGIAVLRYDDRGVGGSTGNVNQSTTLDFAGDALAGVRLLRGRADINPDQVGLLGHSEGGLVAPLAATRSPEVAFIVLMAGPGLPGSEIILAQLQLILRAEGLDEAQIAEQLDLQRKILTAVQTGEGWAEVEAELERAVRESLEEMPESQRESITDADQFINAMIQQRVQAVRTPWFEYFVGYDPRPALEQVGVPVLALFGELDLQVPAEMNRVAVETALARGGNPDYTTLTLPGANHLFQPAHTGSPSEYANLPGEFVPGFLEAISGWLLERVTAPALIAGE